MKQTPTKHMPKQHRVQSTPRAGTASKPRPAMTPMAVQSQKVVATVPPFLAMFPVVSDIRAAPWMPESLWEGDNEDWDERKAGKVGVHICFSLAAHSE